MKSIHFICSLVAAAALAACGGGGSDDASTSSTPDTTADSGTGTDNTATTPTPDYTGDCGIANFASSTLASVNAFRAQARTCGTTVYPAQAALVWDQKLARAAQLHSQDMVTNNFFSHTSFDGRTLGTRVTAAGYTWTAVGENIAAGQGTMAAVMTSWQQSEGHCKNLMSASFTAIGLSCKKGTSANTYTPYWTMDLARP